MALCTQAQVEQRLQIDFTVDPDPVVAELIAAATGHIERIAERSLEAAVREEVFDPPSTPNLWLTHTPVAVTSTSTPFAVEVDGTPLASDQYSVDPQTGRLTRVINGRPRSWSEYKVQSITVDYRGGYETVPYDIQDICARMVARAFQAGAAYAALPTSSASVNSVDIEGAGSVEYNEASGDVSTSAFLTAEELETIKYYRNGYLA